MRPRLHAADLVLVLGGIVLLVVPYFRPTEVVETLPAALGALPRDALPPAPIAVTPPARWLASATRRPGPPACSASRTAR